jgi:hypothetical protein
LAKAGFPSRKQAKSNNKIFPQVFSFEFMSLSSSSVTLIGIAGPTHFSWLDDDRVAISFERRFGPSVPQHMVRRFCSLTSIAGTTVLGK